MQYYENRRSRRQRLKLSAKIGIHGRILASFGACMIPALITWGMRFFPSDIFVVNFSMFDQYILSVSLLMMGISALASIFATGPLEAGLSGYFTRLLRNRENPPSALSVCDCFGAGYRRLSAGMFAYRALSVLVHAVPLLLMLLPGMLSVEEVEGFKVFSVAAAMWPLLALSAAVNLYVDTALSMTPYILINEGTLSVREALVKSFQMTRGHVLELLILEISFLPWYFFIFMTLSVGTIYVSPYVRATYAAYYLEFSGNLRRGEEEAARAD